MPVFRPSRSDIDLSNYWNALNRNAPAEEISRLAQLVEQSSWRRFTPGPGQLQRGICT